MSQTHNENSRVKIPAILHLMRLGYDYLSLKNENWDKQTNIFPDIFIESLCRINPDLSPDDARRLLTDITIELDNEDLGQKFYERLTNQSGGKKLIDFQNFDNNSFHVVTELPCINGDEEFRPDITLLINGMPLVFIEVKKPNNKGGIGEERERMGKRANNPKFRRFINITQFMIFSNNMEYDDGATEPAQGAFYASSAYGKPVFNYFREEHKLNLAELLNTLSDDLENNILQDNNLPVIKHSPEFISNKSPDTPTNRILTSLLCRERLSFLLQHGLTYVKASQGLVQKHIMRYPQLFATLAIEKHLASGGKKGVIWHTQGSGKTALAYYNTRYLTHYYAKQGIVPKFYFIVDRLDLLKQAQREFTARDLVVHTIDSREAFAADIRSAQTLHNHAGKAEITVVNIQKFQDDPNVVARNDYDLAIQRVYFLDEVHRSYNPQGSFLANLNQSDVNAVKIGLTGTPLIGVTAGNVNTRELFGDYIHKYYYNASIADGYTLRLIREAISSQYKAELQAALAQLEVEKGSFDRKEIYAHPHFVRPMLDYILDDFAKFRKTNQDESLGAMVVCDSAEQARQLFDHFQTASDHNLTAALILHDVGTKDERDQWVKDFKAGKIDILFVYNMLLTGFDAPRLKKLYLGRLIKAHNLLQTLTRVNRTYKSYRYGYVVDFADIEREFDKTNRAYWDELSNELGDEIGSYSQLFKTAEEIEQEIADIKNALFDFDTENAEEFCSQISQIEDKKQLLALKKALQTAKELYNILRLQGSHEFLAHLDFDKLNLLYRETAARLDTLNLAEKLQQGDTAHLLNEALEDVYFQFVKIGEAELKLADDLKDIMRKVREGLAGNFDQDDPEYISLREELERIFKKKNLAEVGQEEMQANIATLETVYAKIKELNRQNDLLRHKYGGDAKYARTHKRLMENPALYGDKLKVFNALNGVKTDADQKVLDMEQILDNQNYFEKQMQGIVLKRFRTEQQFPVQPTDIQTINRLLVREYLKESGRI
ncbi:type I restriction endonuclease subunit R [Aggregatibacter segnis]|uniref:type I site-specific deoxyribonuclease n=1 Tax=Aggregatibacter segnis TaxID=739 RepID=A0A8B2U4W0_9PAST|nr:type I restriction endonuclease [Aggregatibacter segnis]RDE71587.1 type I restriction endonuclease subunit R [Aggregatibacter segnis]